MALQSLHNKYLRVLEKIFSRSWLLTKLYIAIQDKIIIDEFSSIPIKDESNVLVIGCGSIPNTVVSLAKIKKWNIVGIDRDKDAVDAAKKIIERYQLRNVEIKHADGKDADLKNFNLIVVALGTEPKKEILEKISKDAKKGTYIVCRTAGSFSLVFGKEEMNVRNLEILDRKMRKDGTESVILIKR